MTETKKGTDLVLSWARCWELLKATNSVPDWVQDLVLVKEPRWGRTNC